VKIRVFALCLASIIVALATYVGSAPSSVGSEARVPMSLSAEAIQTAASAAELARLIGDGPARERQLREAQRLFVEMGATARAQQLARDVA